MQACHSPSRVRAALSSAITVATLAMAAPLTQACLTHALAGGTESASSAFAVTSSTSLLIAPPALAVATTVADQVTTITDPAVTGWMQNTTGKKGSSPNAQINAFVSVIDADVRSVAYSATHVYVRASGVPSHPVGGFANNPAYPADQNRLARIPRTPQVNNGAKTATGLGNVGIMVNGATFFNARDAMTYQNQGVWQQNANYFEAATFDAGKGHPAPGMMGGGGGGTLVPGNYHYHQAPIDLLNQLDPGNTGQHHSPLLGFAFDGFPIYGPYGYTNPDGTGGIARQSSSYQLRNITTRTTLPNGQPAASAGPTVAQVPLGAYVQDYAYVAGSGTLDQYNGRFAVTPEYPQGTFAYFVTLNAAGSAVYPYIVGPSYYGIVDTGNLQGGSITVPTDVAYYVAPVPEPASIALLGFAAYFLSRRRGGV